MNETMVKAVNQRLATDRISWLLLHIAGFSTRPRTMAGGSKVFPSNGEGSIVLAKICHCFIYTLCIFPNRGSTEKRQFNRGGGVRSTMR